MNDFLDMLGAPPDDALAAVRSAGRARFAESGFPTRRTEAWRFTELRKLTETRFGPASAGIAGMPAIDEIADADRLVFINGCFVADRSRIGTLPKGVFLGSFADWARAHADEAAASFDLAGGADRAFLSLNAAFATDGLALIVPAGVKLDRRIQVIHIASAVEPAASHLKHLVRLGDGAEAVLVESFTGSGPHWTNASATVELGDDAKLGHYKLQNEAAEATHIAHHAVTIGARGHYDGFLLTLGAGLSRQDMRATIAGPDAFCGFSGAYLLAGRQDATMASVILHAAPNGRTHEVFKGCLADRAHGVFQGQIRVAQAAQKTDAYQLNKTLLLSDRAVMDSKPELEIFADDVKCSHGATIGDLDETALFYLRSRGIEAEQARRMLIEAFVVDAVDLISDEVVRNHFIAAIGHWLAARKEPA
ncbi:MAG TPA: Fe-S cluster assembly protein SufD [Aliidongia sp.]|nr:Fe-S cluster assembly protein SufD [Aliidongia sp.]